jgi:UDP-2,3-diacylglucosamine hydrolase
MTTLFISDLHLSPDNPKLIDLTIKFLQQQTHDISTLYILGDLFNTWLGDDVVPVEFLPLINQLQQLHKTGISSYIMVGNRDFMLGEKFAQQCGSQLIQEPTVVNIAGQRMLLMHGDSLCTDDVSYQRYRQWSRNRLLQWCFLKLPTSIRQHISDKIKQKSREQKQYKTAMIMDVNQEAVEKVFMNHDVSYLIHGHTHRPAIHQLTIADKTVYRIVLGDWNDKVSFLKCDEQSLTLSDHRIVKNQTPLRLN